MPRSSEAHRDSPCKWWKDGPSLRSQLAVDKNCCVCKEGPGLNGCEGRHRVAAVQRRKCAELDPLSHPVFFS